METRLRWSKRIFASTYNIFSDDELIGKLKDRLFSQTAEGEFNGKKYTFKTKGLFRQRTQILDSLDNKVVGEIIYNSWMTKATLLILNKKFHWKYENIWNTKWRIFNTEGMQIHYHGYSTSGKIDANTNDDLLLLSGLFVAYYYWQMTVAMLIPVFVAVWSTLLN